MRGKSHIKQLDGTKLEIWKITSSERFSQHKSFQSKKYRATAKIQSLWFSVSLFSCIILRRPAFTVFHVHFQTRTPSK